MIVIKMDNGDSVYASRFVQVYGRSDEACYQMMNWLYNHVEHKYKMWLKNVSDSSFGKMDLGSTVLFLTGEVDLERLPKNCAGYVLDMRDHPRLDVDKKNVIIKTAKVSDGCIGIFMNPRWGTGIHISGEEVN